MIPTSHSRTLDGSVESEQTSTGVGSHSLLSVSSSSSNTSHASQHRSQSDSSQGTSASFRSDDAFVGDRKGIEEGRRIVNAKRSSKTNLDDTQALSSDASILVSAESKGISGSEGLDSLLTEVSGSHRSSIRRSGRRKHISPSSLRTSDSMNQSDDGYQKRVAIGSSKSTYPKACTYSLSRSFDIENASLSSDDGYESGKSSGNLSMSLHADARESLSMPCTAEGLHGDYVDSGSDNPAILPPFSVLINATTSSASPSAQPHLTNSEEKVAHNLESQSLGKDEKTLIRESSSDMDRSGFFHPHSSPPVANLPSLRSMNPLLPWSSSNPMFGVYPGQVHFPQPWIPNTTPFQSPGILSAPPDLGSIANWRTRQVTPDLYRFVSECEGTRSLSDRSPYIDMSRHVMHNVPSDGEFSSRAQQDRLRQMIAASSHDGESVPRFQSDSLASSGSPFIGPIHHSPAFAPLLSSLLPENHPDSDFRRQLFHSLSRRSSNSSSWTTDTSSDWSIGKMPKTSPSLVPTSRPSTYQWVYSPHFDQPNSLSLLSSSSHPRIELPTSSSMYGTQPSSVSRFAHSTPSYHCPVCQRGYTTLSNLRRHQRNKHDAPYRRRSRLRRAREELALRMSADKSNSA